MLVRTIIFYVIMVAVLATLLIVGIKLFMSETKKAIVETGFMMQIQCKKCGYKRQMSVKEYPFGGMTRSKGATKAKMEGVTVVNAPTYSSYAKQIHCFQCGDKQWTEVLNINEYNTKFRGLVIKHGIVWAAAMVIAMKMLSELVLIPLSKLLL